MVSVSDTPCQLTGYTIYNPNTVDVWIKFHDSTNTTSAATGITSAYKLMIPAKQQLVEYIGNTDDADGMWAFVMGLTIKCVTTYTGTPETPLLPIEIYMQTKP